MDHRLSLNELNSRLLTSANRGDKITVKNLIDMGADVNIMGTFGHTPLIEAVLNNHIATIMTLLNCPKTKINQSAEFGRPSLILAARKGNAGAVRVLIDDPNIDINQSDQYGRTALIEAAYYNHIDTIKILVSANKIDINQHDEDGKQAIQVAIEQKNWEIVIFLSTQGASIPKGFNTHFMQEELNEQLLNAAFEGDHKLVAHLLFIGAEINTVDEYGETALIKATKHNCLSVCNVLLNTPGILVNKANESGGTALMWAARNGYLILVQKLLQQRGILVNMVEELGESALFLAAKYNHIEVVEALLSVNHINLDNENKEGKTAVIAALRNGNYAVVRLLERHGAFLPLYLKQASYHNKHRSYSAEKCKLIPRPTLCKTRSKSLDPRWVSTEREHDNMRDASSVTLLFVGKTRRPRLHSCEEKKTNHSQNIDSVKKLSIDCASMGLG
jgi:ankyrin repeat protein